MNTPTLTKPRIIAIGRCVGGSAFKVTAPPVDWPTDDEIADIIRINNYASAIKSLMDPADYRRYRKMCKRSNV